MIIYLQTITTRENAKLNSDWDIFFLRNKWLLKSLKIRKQENPNSLVLVI